ncbi:MAG: TCR/Tet family MFS transporter [Betaproteobacteria bacterium]|nr:TCR/Tet family MFS transporter [Betaproteobacteria bacterium]
MTPTESPAPTGGPRRAAFIFIFIVVLLDILAFGIIIPVLPKLVERFMDGKTDEAARMYGYMTLSWGVMQFFCMPLVGMLSDRFGRRPVILISCLGLGLDFILMALAPDLTWLFIGRVLSGATSASFSTAFAYIADVTPQAQRAAKFGLLGAAFGIGFVIGPALGGVLGGFDPRWPFWAAAALALSNVAYGFFVLPESLPPEKRAQFQWKKANPVGSLALLRRHPELFGLAGVLLLMNVAHIVLPSTAVLYMSYRYGWSEMAMGLTLALVGVCAIVVQGGLMKPAIAKFGERKLLVIGLIFGVIGFAGYGLAPTGIVFLLAIPVMSLWGFAGPAAQALMTRHVNATEQGQLQGANSCLMSISGIVGPLLFTQVFSVFIGTQKGWHLPGAPFLLAGMMLVLAVWIAWQVTRSEINTTPPDAPRA